MSRLQLAHHTSVVVFLIFVSFLVTDGWRTFPNPVPIWGRVLLGLIVLLNLCCIPIGAIGALDERRYGKTTIALSLIPLLYIVFIWWVGIA